LPCRALLHAEGGIERRGSSQLEERRHGGRREQDEGQDNVEVEGTEVLAAALDPDSDVTARRALAASG